MMGSLNMVFGAHRDTATSKPDLTKVILEIHRKASEFAMKNPNEMAAMAVAKLGQKKEAIEISIPNVELTWKFGPKEIEQSKIYASHMLALKQIKQLPDFATFFDTSYVVGDGEAGLSITLGTAPVAPMTAAPTVAPAPQSVSFFSRLRNPLLAVAISRRGADRSGTSPLTARNSALIPPPSDVAVALWDLAFGGINDDAFSRTLHIHLLASLSRVYGGFAIALAVALPLGLLIGRVAVVRQLLDPTLQVLAADSGDGLAAACHDHVRPRTALGLLSGLSRRVLSDPHQHDFRRALGRSATVRGRQHARLPATRRSSSASCCPQACRRSSRACGSGSASPGW